MFNYFELPLLPSKSPGGLSVMDLNPTNLIKKKNSPHQSSNNVLDVYEDRD